MRRVALMFPLVLAALLLPSCAATEGVLGSTEPTEGPDSDVQGDTESWPRVVLNELVARNQASAADPLGRFPDWIELLNRSNRAVDLSGWSLSDDPDEPALHTLDPLRLPAGERLLLWADGAPELGPRHLALALDSTGDLLALYAPDGTTMDLLTFGPQAVDISLARLPDGDGSWELSTTPTPGRPNEEAR